MSHRLTVRAVCDAAGQTGVEAECSCGAMVLLDEHVISLDRLAELQHAHITEAERQVDPVVNPRSVLPPEFYGDAGEQVEHTDSFSQPSRREYHMPGYDDVPEWTLHG